MTGELELESSARTRARPRIRIAGTGDPAGGRLQQRTVAEPPSRFSESLWKPDPVRFKWRVVLLDR